MPRSVPPLLGTCIPGGNLLDASWSPLTGTAIVAIASATCVLLAAPLRQLASNSPPPEGHVFETSHIAETILPF